MNKFHLNYENLNKLEQFIISNKLNIYNKIIVKIYTEFIINNELQSIKNLVSKLLPNAKVMAIINDDNFMDYKNNNDNKILICISIYDEKIGNIHNYKKSLIEVNAASEFNYKTRIDKRVIDQLVNVYNRQKLVTDIKEPRFNKIALIDLVRFKKINNFYGNDIGDELLIKVANFFKDNTKNENIRIYRISGDVFAFMGHISLENQLFIDFMKSLHLKLKLKRFIVGEEEIFLNAILAVAFDTDNLLEKAGLTLEYAKKENEDYFEFDKGLDLISETKNNLVWTSILRRAIADDRVIPYFQGIFNNKTNNIEKYEALMRIVDENGNAITPYHFLEIARQSGLYKNMMKMIINKTFDKFKNTKYSFSINLWRKDMLDGEIKDLIIKRLDEGDYKNRVIFEILETENIQNYDSLKDFIEKVKKRGAKIAIDDFGTGYANYDHLIKIKPDIIKIDGSIIRNIGNDKKSFVATESILYFAKKFGCLTVAEFVSDEDIYARVKDLNIEFSQGYYFSIPESDPF